MISGFPSRIAIVGPGLLGGSLLMALRQLLPEAHLRVWARREESVQQIRHLAIADVASTDLQTVAADAELVVLCTPVETMTDLARSLLKAALAPGCVITDVGSVKGSIVSSLEDVFASSGFDFIGSHPMAGSERAGLEAARADLFTRQVCLVTPSLFTTDHALQTARALWELLGCRVMEMSAEEHDRKIARISHLPHVAAAVTTLAALQDDFSASACAGNGFRDTTRVSAGDADLWTGILLQNRADVVDAVRAASDRFSELLAILEIGDEIGLRRFLREAKMLRDSVPQVSSL